VLPTLVAAASEMGSRMYEGRASTGSISGNIRIINSSGRENFECD
jgi:hypothetical protein